MAHYKTRKVTFTLKELEYEEMKRKEVLEKIFESKKKKVEVTENGEFRTISLTDSQFTFNKLKYLQNEYESLRYTIIPTLWLQPENDGMLIEKEGKLFYYFCLSLQIFQQKLREKKK